jgi:hypothetical protein
MPFNCFPTGVIPILIIWPLCLYCQSQKIDQNALLWLKYSKCVLYTTNSKW